MKSLIFLSACLMLCYSTYVPILPKMPPTTKVQVIDLQKEHDAANQMENYTAHQTALELGIAVTTLQGIVNKVSSEKIHLSLIPSNGNTWPSYLVIPAGLYPNVNISGWDFQTQEPENTGYNMSLTYPALPFAIDKFKSFIKGKIIWAGLSGENNFTTFQVDKASLSCAFTAAGQESAIVLSPRVDAYLTSLGYNFPLIHNVSSINDDIAAYNWSMANYWSKVDKTFVVNMRNAGTDDLWSEDYWIASGVFCTNLDPLNATHVPFLANLTKSYNSSVLIWVESEDATTYVLPEFGGYVGLYYAPNWSVLSSFVLDPEEYLYKKAAPEALQIDENGVYIGFFLTDGDSGQFDVGYMLADLFWQNSNYSHYLNYLSYSINPHLMDLAPTLLKFFANSTKELTMKFNDGGAPFWQTKTGRPDGTDYNTFTDIWRHYIQNEDKSYMDNLNNSFNSANIDYVDWATYNTLINLEAYYASGRYCACMWAGPQFEWQLIRNTVFTQIAPGYGAVDSANRAIDGTPKGTPVFAIIGAGDGTHTGADDIQSTMDNLTLRTDSRNYYYTLPQNVAATWKAWAKPQVNHAAMKPTIATSWYEDCHSIPGVIYNGDYQPVSNFGYCNANWVNYCCNSTFGYDGFETTWWTPDHNSLYNSLTVDMKNTIVVNSVYFSVQSCPFNYSISLDNSTWTLVHSHNQVQKSNFTIPVSSIPSRYGRFDTINNCSVTVQVYEIAIYGPIQDCSNMNCTANSVCVNATCLCSNGFTMEGSTCVQEEMSSSSSLKSQLLILMCALLLSFLYY